MSGVHQPDHGVVHARGEDAVDDEFRLGKIAEFEFRRRPAAHRQNAHRRRQTQAQCRWLRASENGARGCGPLRRAGHRPARGSACTRRRLCRSASHDKDTQRVCSPLLAVMRPGRKRHGAVRADIPKRKRAALLRRAPAPRARPGFRGGTSPRASVRAKWRRNTKGRGEARSLPREIHDRGDGDKAQPRRRDNAAQAKRGQDAAAEAKFARARPVQRAAGEENHAHGAGDNARERGE